MTMKILHINKQRGLTLVELMIAMALSILLAGAIAMTFANNSKSFSRDENIQRMQDDSRHAMRELSFEISMAGHFASLLDPRLISGDTDLAVTTDCGPVAATNWIYEVFDVGTSKTTSLTALDNASAAAANAAFSCIAASEFQAGTDVIAIKRVAGAESAANTSGSVYLRTNGSLGVLISEPVTTAGAALVSGTIENWEYRPSIYYIRNFGGTPNDGIPTLCRKVLDDAAPSMSTECLARGIEDMQIEYGLDTNLDGDPNVFISSPTQLQMQTVVATKIFLLARSVDDDFGYTNDKTYNLSNTAAYTPADTFHRRVMSLTVGIKNTRAMIVLGLNDDT
jgi:type IV pilus assembly protein PilW